MPFTISRLAEALRGIPRDARIVVRLPTGELAEIELVKPTRLLADNTELAPGASETQGGAYGVVLVVAAKR